MIKISQTGVWRWKVYHVYSTNRSQDLHLKRREPLGSPLGAFKYGQSDSKSRSVMPRLRKIGLKLSDWEELIITDSLFRDP